MGATIPPRLSQAGDSAIGTMIAWLDIVSPHLRAYHDRWVGLRGDRLIPRVEDYPAFAKTAPSELSARIDVPAAVTLPAFAYIGGKLQGVLGKVRRGQQIEDVSSPVVRESVSAAAYRVIQTRQPDCRRCQAAFLDDMPMVECLMLPFGSNSGVHMIHAIYELVERP